MCITGMNLDEFQKGNKNSETILFSFLETEIKLFHCFFLSFESMPRNETGRVRGLNPVMTL